MRTTIPGRPRAARRLVLICGVLGAALLTQGCAGQGSAVASPTLSASAASAADESSDPDFSDAALLADEVAALATPDPADQVDVAQAAAGATPRTVLATALLLEVKGRAPTTGYARDQFGSAWKDVDRNGCDQRNDVLARDLTDIAHKPGTKGCVVLSGVLADPYSGTRITFERGQSTSSAVQIDHVVALSDAWQKGAQAWDAATREKFANDFLNLLAVDGPLNQQKQAGDAATWLPPHKAYRCAYVARQVGVKYTYGLWVTQAEQNAMVSVLSACPDEPLPSGATVPPEPVVETSPAAEPGAPADNPAAPAPEPAPAAPAPEPAPEVAGDAVYFTNCTAAWAAGAAPVLLGSAGYGKHLDRDGDGVGCENRP